MEVAICRIAQKARAVGIHMIISTQRPDTKIVTGSIKANFPTRIAFRTTTGTDSRVILDRIGAERLIGKGDMIFFNGGEQQRVQCAYISTEDVVEMCEEMKEEYADRVPTILPSTQAEFSDNQPKFQMSGRYEINEYGQRIYVTDYGLTIVL
jgi:S-DNA-T family DNA segregation ATPase FtsK/SpoIIIE